MPRSCKHCGAELPRQIKGRPREACDTCKPRRTLAVVDAVEEAPATQATAGPLEAATLAELTKACRQDTVEGQLSLLLARKAEHREATASAAAAAARELRASLAAALAGTKQADGVDDLSARRRAVGGQ